ncbi:MAG: hypothetical protein GEV08_03025 [Acidimicrobiia bacterium]|nr:hypothetical protein [Acidimicrobiia bacterium]
MERSALTSLAPGDAAVALRSLPRRFRESFRAPELAGEPAALDPAAVPRSGGPSPLGLVLGASRALDGMRRAIDRTLASDSPALDGTVFDREARDRLSEASGSIGGALAALEGSVEALAADLDRAPLKDWARPATVGGQRVDALELLKEALASARTYLDRLGPTLESLRRET